MTGEPGTADGGAQQIPRAAVLHHSIIASVRLRMMYDRASQIDDCLTSAAFLRTFSHECRLAVLFQLHSLGPQTFQQLNGRLRYKAAALLPHIQKLRREGIISKKGRGDHAVYCIAGDKAASTIELMIALFCSPLASRRRKLLSHVSEHLKVVATP